MERVTGIGGVFIRARDAAALGKWYATHLGIDVGDWGGVQFHWQPGGSTTWSLFPADTPYFGTLDQQAMVNFRVLDLDAMLAQLRAAGVEVVGDVSGDDFVARVEEHEYGRFGWAVDPEGNRFELWQPPEGN